MRLLVTGASGFVGAHFCRVAAHKHDVYAGYFSTPVHLNNVTPIRADIRKGRDIKRMLSLDFDAVIHIATKIKAVPQSGESPSQAAYEENRQMMQGILSMQKPILYASSTVVHWDSDCPYAQSRRDDEDDIRQSGLPYAILRPSAPYGPVLANHQPRHKESFHTLVDIIRYSPVVPVIGSGEYRRQPIHVVDFARAGLSLLEQGLPSQEFAAGGLTAHSFNQMIDMLAHAMRKKRRKLSLPKSLFVQLSKWRSDFDPSLLSAVDEDELADPKDLMQVSGVSIRSFAEGLVDLI